METLTLNFDTWNSGARGGRLRIIYKRIFIKGYKWTPFVIVKWKWFDKKTTKAFRNKDTKQQS